MIRIFTIKTTLQLRQLWSSPNGGPNWGFYCICIFQLKLTFHYFPDRPRVMSKSFCWFSLVFTCVFAKHVTWYSNLRAVPYLLNSMWRKAELGPVPLNPYWGRTWVNFQAKYSNYTWKNQDIVIDYDSYRVQLRYINLCVNTWFSSLSDDLVMSKNRTVVVFVFNLHNQCRLYVTCAISNPTK
jgi:hypothetical protein